MVWPQLLQTIAPPECAIILRNFPFSAQSGSVHEHSRGLWAGEGLLPFGSSASSCFQTRPSLIACLLSSSKAFTSSFERARIRSGSYSAATRATSVSQSRRAAFAFCCNIERLPRSLYRGVRIQIVGGSRGRQHRKRKPQQAPKRNQARPFKANRSRKLGWETGIESSPERKYNDMQVSG